MNHKQVLVYLALGGSDLLQKHNGVGGCFDFYSSVLSGFEAMALFLVREVQEGKDQSQLS